MGMASDPKVAPAMLVHGFLLARARRLRQNSAFISASAVGMRKQYLSTDSRAFGGNDDTRANRVSVFFGEEAEGNMDDPMGMMGGLKAQLAMMLPNMLQMGWVNWFFTGFVALRLPFSLTDRFKAMVQRGINLRSLDGAYVSSLSWFFLLMFSMRGVHTLFLGSAEFLPNEEKAMMAGMPGAGGPSPMGGPQIDFKKVYEEEKRELEVLQYEFAPAEAEFRLAGVPVPSKTKTVGG